MSVGRWVPVILGVAVGVSAMLALAGVLLLVGAFGSWVAYPLSDGNVPTEEMVEQARLAAWGMVGLAATVGVPSAFLLAGLAGRDHLVGAASSERSEPGPQPAATVEFTASS